MKKINWEKCAEDYLLSTEMFSNLTEIGNRSSARVSFNKNFVHLNNLLRKYTYLSSALTGAGRTVGPRLWGRVDKMIYEGLQKFCARALTTDNVNKVELSLCMESSSFVNHNHTLSKVMKT